MWKGWVGGRVAYIAAGMGGVGTSAIPCATCVVCFVQLRLHQLSLHLHSPYCLCELQGQKYEALNMAGLWNIPVIFVCENNHYGGFTDALSCAACAVIHPPQKHVCRWS